MNYRLRFDRIYFICRFVLQKRKIEGCTKPLCFYKELSSVTSSLHEKAILHVTFEIVGLTCIIQTWWVNLQTKLTWKIVLLKTLYYLIYPHIHRTIKIICSWWLTPGVQSRMIEKYFASLMTLKMENWTLWAKREIKSF